MVLISLGEQVDYPRLLQRLGTTASGAPFSNLAQLRTWQFAVELAKGNLRILQQRLAQGNPVIVPVATELLPYWILRTDIPERERMTEHAIVVIGLDEEQIYVHDPDFAAAPQVVDVGWFTEARRHHDHWYAVIRRRFG